MRLNAGEKVWSPTGSARGLVVLQAGRKPPRDLEIYLELVKELYLRLLREANDQEIQRADSVIEVADNWDRDWVIPVAEMSRLDRKGKRAEVDDLLGAMFSPA